MASQLVDIKLTIHASSTEVELDADLDLDTFRDNLRDAMAAWTIRGIGDDVESPLVIVTAEVTPV